MTVTGDVTANGGSGEPEYLVCGVNGITVTGDVSGASKSYGNGILAYGSVEVGSIGQNDGLVVSGSAIARGDNGITVKGNVTGSNTNSSGHGLQSLRGSITVNGDVNLTTTSGHLLDSETGNITVIGDVSGSTNIQDAAVYGKDGTVTLGSVGCAKGEDGNPIGLTNRTGMLVFGNSGITVNGNVDGTCSDDGLYVTAGDIVMTGADSVWRITAGAGKAAINTNGSITYPNTHGITKPVGGKVGQDPSVETRKVILTPDGTVASAVVIEPVYDITVEGTPTNSGTVKATVEGIVVEKAGKDATVTVAAEPTDGYEVASVTSDDVDIAGDNTFTMPGKAVTVTVQFKKAITLGLP